MRTTGKYKKARESLLSKSKLIEMGAGRKEVAALTNPDEAVRGYCGYKAELFDLSRPDVKRLFNATIKDCKKGKLFVPDFWIPDVVRAARAHAKEHGLKLTVANIQTWVVNAVCKEVQAQSKKSSVTSSGSVQDEPVEGGAVCAT
jgi:hypothetical protein